MVPCDLIDVDHDKALRRIMLARFKIFASMFSGKDIQGLFIPETHETMGRVGLKLECTPEL